jgi:rhodanese-related sulfurtransferase
MGFSRQILLIIGLATLGALLQGLVQGPPASLAETDASAVVLSSALAMKGALFVDARSEEAFEESHYPGAIHLSEDNWDTGLGRVVQAWEPGLPVIVYCDGDGCASSRKLAERLRTELGLEPVYWLVGGWEAIEAAEVLP